MARDKSPIVKQSRREGYALAPKAHKVMAKKTGIPGQHAGMRQRGGSLYLTQLREKQKVRRLYGLLEKQFAKLMKEATRAEDGMPLVFRAAFKPTPSIAKEQQTVSLSRMENTTLSIKGRHDPCVVLRAVPVVEAVAALAVLDLLLDETK